MSLADMGLVVQYQAGHQHLQRHGGYHLRRRCAPESLSSSSSTSSSTSASSSSSLTSTFKSGMSPDCGELLLYSMTPGKTSPDIQQAESNYDCYPEKRQPPVRVAAAAAAVAVEVDVSEFLDRLFAQPLGLGFGEIFQEAFTLTALDRRTFAPALEGGSDRRRQNLRDACETLGIGAPLYDLLLASGFTSVTLLSLWRPDSPSWTNRIRSVDSLGSLWRSVQTLNATPLEPLYSLRRFVDHHRRRNRTEIGGSRGGNNLAEALDLARGSPEGATSRGSDDCRRKSSAIEALRQIGVDWAGTRPLVIKATFSSSARGSLGLQRGSSGFENDDANVASSGKANGGADFWGASVYKPQKVAAKRLSLPSKPFPRKPGQKVKPQGVGGHRSPSSGSFSSALTFSQRGQQLGPQGDSPHRTLLQPLQGPATFCDNVNLGCKATFFENFRKFHELRCKFVEACCPFIDCFRPVILAKVEEHLAVCHDMPRVSSRSSSSCSVEGSSFKRLAGKAPLDPGLMSGYSAPWLLPVKEQALFSSSAGKDWGNPESEDGDSSSSSSRRIGAFRGYRVSCYKEGSVLTQINVFLGGQGNKDYKDYSWWGPQVFELDRRSFYLIIYKFRAPPAAGVVAGSPANFKGPVCYALVLRTNSTREVARKYVYEVRLCERPWLHPGPNRADDGQSPPRRVNSFMGNVGSLQAGPDRLLHTDPVQYLMAHRRDIVVIDQATLARCLAPQSRGGVVGCEIKVYCLNNEGG